MSLVHKNDIGCITESHIERHMDWWLHPKSKFYRHSGALKWDVDNW